MNGMSENKYDEAKILPIGTKNGCFTIIAGFEAYQEERAKEKISKLEENKQRFLRGEQLPWCNFDSADTFDKRIAEEKSRKLYKIQCKCGKTSFALESFIFLKKWRDCGDDCDLKVQREAKKIASYPRVKSADYDVSFLNNTHDSLKIIECTNDNLEGRIVVNDRRKKGAGQVYLYKEFRCQCYLCGREYFFRSDRFKIKSDSYGARADIGYYCDAHCECRDNSSSFQWRTVKIFHEFSVPYAVEISFADLLSERGNPLRFDFAILDDKSNIKYLVECQGKQHYEANDHFGGVGGLMVCQTRDEQKRQYSQIHNIPLIEIPYTCNTYEKEVEFLRKSGLI